MAASGIDTDSRPLEGRRSERTAHAVYMGRAQGVERGAAPPPFPSLAPHEQTRKRRTKNGLSAAASVRPSARPGQVAVEAAAAAAVSLDL